MYRDMIHIRFDKIKVTNNNFHYQNKFEEVKKKIIA